MPTWFSDKWAPFDLRQKGKLGLPTYALWFLKWQCFCWYRLWGTKTAFYWVFARYVRYVMQTLLLTFKNPIRRENPLPRLQKRKSRLREIEQLASAPQDSKWDRRCESFALAPGSPGLQAHPQSSWWESSSQFYPPATPSSAPGSSGRTGYGYWSARPNRGTASPPSAARRAGPSSSPGCTRRSWSWACGRGGAPSASALKGGQSRRSGTLRQEDSPQ